MIDLIGRGIYLLCKGFSHLRVKSSSRFLHQGISGDTVLKYAESILFRKPGSRREHFQKLRRGLLLSSFFSLLHSGSCCFLVCCCGDALHYLRTGGIEHFAVSLQQRIDDARVFARVEVLAESLIYEALIELELLRILVVFLEDVIDHAFAAFAKRLVHVLFYLLCRVVCGEILDLLLCDVLYLFLHGVRIDVTAECALQLVLVDADHILKTQTLVGVVSDVFEALSAEYVDVLVEELDLHDV